MPTPNPSPAPAIRDLEQLRALASPVRQEIIDALHAAGPCSMSELADLLARPVDSLYFHVRRLLKVRLVVELDARKTGRHVASMYDLPARPVRIDYRILSSPAGARALRSVVHGALRLSLREFDSATRSVDIQQVEQTRDFWGGRTKGWLTESQHRRVVALLDELHTIFQTAQPTPHTRAMALGFVLTPCRVSPRLTPPPAPPPSPARRRSSRKSSKGT